MYFNCRQVNLFFFFLNSDLVSEKKTSDLPRDPNLLSFSLSLITRVKTVDFNNLLWKNSQRSIAESESHVWHLDSPLPGSFVPQSLSRGSIN